MSIKKHNYSNILFSFVIILSVLFYLNNVNSNLTLAWAASKSNQPKKATRETDWYLTNWGMTPKEVTKALDNKYVIVQKPVKKDGDDIIYAIENFEIGKFLFYVSLSFKSEGGLYNVTVMKRGQDGLYECFLDLEDALKTKYGKPSSVEDNKNRYGDGALTTEGHYREWHTQSTFIKLTNIGLNPGGMTKISYSYRNSSSEKL